MEIDVKLDYFPVPVYSFLCMPGLLHYITLSGPHQSLDELLHLPK